LTYTGSESKKRKSIYFLTGKIAVIMPVNREQITEISIMKYLSIYYDVYYNNQLINFTKKNLD
jgi:hypothetical protein